jgi:hypothetical protein
VLRRVHAAADCVKYVVNELFSGSADCGHVLLANCSEEQYRYNLVKYLVVRCTRSTLARSHNDTGSRRNLDFLDSDISMDAGHGNAVRTVDRQ